MNKIKLLLIILSITASPFCFAATDSTDVTPLVNPGIRYIGASSNPPVINRERYDELPICPDVPTNCPDINSTGGNTTTCPDYCTKTRSPAVLSASLTNQVTTPIVDATCPAAYTMIGVYNMQNEAVYNASPPVIRPIYGINEYFKYQGSGYTCVTYGAVQESDQYCSGEYSDGEVVDTVNNAGGAVTYILNSYSKSCHLKGSCGHHACTPGLDPNWTYRYQFMQCTPPAGVYLTGNIAPVSVVCARAKDTWKQLN